MLELPGAEGGEGKGDGKKGGAWGKGAQLFFVSPFKRAGNTRSCASRVFSSLFPRVIG